MSEDVSTREVRDAVIDLRDAMAAGFAHVPTRTEMNARFDRVDGRFERVERRLSNVETRLENVETRLGGVEAQVAGLKTEVSRLERRRH